VSFGGWAAKRMDEDSAGLGADEKVGLVAAMQIAVFEGNSLYQ
jgi:hypothetical protein